MEGRELFIGKNEVGEGRVRGVPLKLVIELDGAFHEDAKGYDRWRDNVLTKQGFTVMRFENRVAFEDPESILARITAHYYCVNPSPCPLPTHTK